MDALFNEVSFRTSRLVTNAYSTSFSIGARCLHSSIRDAIYSIYGFVRFADEIVDSFHGYNRQYLLEEFEYQYYKALDEGISLNPVINSFQSTVRKYQIMDELIQSFLSSMKSDLHMKRFEEEEIRHYIYGSAEVVGLMCLKVFVNGDHQEYSRLKPYAMRLGSAFQKINFLRDLKHDTLNLHRVYFPILKKKTFDESTKRYILDDIYEDYRIALIGIEQLPECARLGVYTAYLYYKSLTKKIESIPADKLIHTRIRIPNAKKIMLFGRAYLTIKFN
ncbi:MAG: squalene/phytoene synthase family protein [Bacteroides sp.]|nr:squalene/phytoene synthase family protein [Bacteroides sp.]